MKPKLEESILYNEDASLDTFDALSRAVEYVGDGLQAISHVYVEVPHNHAESAQQLLQLLASLIRFAASDCAKAQRIKAEELARLNETLHQLKTQQMTKQLESKGKPPMTKTAVQQSRIHYISLEIPVCDKDIPQDYPFVFGDYWRPVIDVHTGRICNFIKQPSMQALYIKVKDTGVYTLYDNNLKALHQHKGCVPHGVIPGEYGDYIKLEIGKSGRIKNWPDSPDFKEFLME